MIELAGDSIPGDSLATTMVVSLFLADSADVLSMTGTIDSLSVTRGARITTTDSTPPLPIPLRGIIDRQGGVIRLGDSTAGGADSLCTTTLDPLIAATRDLFVRLPERLTSGTTWQDTVQTTSCRGRIPITTTTIATYTVLGEQAGGRALLAITRSATISLAGGGQQYGRSATVQGTGTGMGTLLFDPQTAALVDGQSQSTMTVTFEAGMLRQTFTQHGRQEIRQR